MAWQKEMQFAFITSVLLFKLKDKCNNTEFDFFIFLKKFLVNYLI